MKERYLVLLAIAACAVAVLAQSDDPNVDPMEKAREAVKRQDYSQAATWFRKAAVPDQRF